MLLPGGRFREKVRGHGGWFYIADLEEDEFWKTLDDDAQRKRLLAYMEECRVITRIADRDSHRLERDVYLASDKWLLPTYEDVEAEIKKKLDDLRAEPGMDAREKFELEDVTISEFDFRSLQAYLAGFFGTRAIYFRTGLQAMEADANPDWCFRIRWSPKSEDAFLGKLDALLVARHQQIEAAVRQIEELLYADAGPLADARKLTNFSTITISPVSFHAFWRRQIGTSFLACADL